ncbi:16S rRNA (guanine(527)-N(7))-methyltransferase RsmG [Funiculus sociatus GB2-A5]|uniref:Ribosomal RNA small subunit methyltransferase G n=1 Tax=Funiculus sociatus GB2-A5 TaxID=2933946 RepID=A0ABV0JQW2_9CYAN|nr:16S rRNA (guanine(527)-N(7))-methyltransferase RsmG [Trichocoleus sp. FACHB-6]MBD2062681.1 16S rRNA (guanine(527)-N(7))-methyltransferase RsmG [Trichocoleus sp. FACHB-6]
MSDIEMPILPEMADVWQQTLGWQPDSEQQKLFQQLYELILAGNRQLNLTRITSPEEFWEKHLWDSLRGIFSQKSEKIAGLSGKAIDIGTGAGFPGIPIAIAFPNYTVSLLDATRKKIAFLENTTSELGLTNVNTITGRAEEIGQYPSDRNAYNLALIRAVAEPSVCAEYALPLLKRGGLAILYRGQWTTEENDTLQPALEKLGGIVESIEEFTTPCSGSIRHCLYLRKVAPTPREFPRAVGVPAQKPL